jgi:hypothetical protein
MSAKRGPGLENPLSAARAFSISVASCAAQTPAESAPRYAPNAFLPHGTADGLQMGENALTLKVGQSRYCSPRHRIPCN